MKLLIVLLTTCLMQVSAASFAQKITYSKKEASLEQIFAAIEQQTGYNIFYSARQVSSAKKMDVNFQNTELKEVLNVLANDHHLAYTIDDQNISVTLKTPTFLERLAERWASIDAFGRVVDAEGKALPGATVKVKATGKGVSTDLKGNFHLKNVEEGAVLVVSYTGYISKEVKAEKEMGSIVLQVSLSKLDEVQVIAYGTTTQRLSTGNVTTIKADVIEKQPVNNPLLALQGRVPGLFIEQLTGFSGGAVKVRIQGENSLNSGNDPFYVIDGVPFISQLLPGGNPILGNSGVSGLNGNPLNFINPSDIESIDILKDADATAIYGSRAANGAILITTKKGKVGDTKINLNLQYGWANVPRKLQLLNSQQYLEMRNEALKNDGISIPAAGPFGDSDLNGNWDNSRYTDWQDVLIGGDAGYQDMNASISGGADRTTFLIGGGMHREMTVFPGEFSDRRGSLHFNINNSSINQKFKLQFSGTYLYDNNQLPNVDFTEKAMSLAPVAPDLYRSDGSVNWAPDGNGTSTFTTNPIGFQFNNFSNKTTNLTSNLLLSYQVFTGLDVKSSFGYNSLSSNIVQKYLLQSIYPELLPYVPRATVFGNNSVNSWSIEPQITYHRNIGKGRLEVLLGTTLQQQRSKAVELSASGFSNDLVMDDILSATSVTPNTSINSIYKYNALFGRLNYNWQDKYILNLTSRRDGSSRFGPGSQFHNFAAIGGAWIFSNEGYILNRLKFLSFGKLRASYGTTGNDQIGDYQFLSLYQPFSQEVPFQGISVYQSNGLTNPYLEWEETKKFQVGIDLGFLKDRLLINANHYNNQSSNQLGTYVLPFTTGFGSIQRNQPYKFQNYGWEFMITSTNINLKDFRWTSSFNFTIPHKKWLDYPGLDQSSDAYRAIVGKSYNSLKLYHSLGVDPKTGVYQFLDRNGKATTTPDDLLDKTVILDLTTRYGGLQNTFIYKNFQIDFLLSFAKQIAQDNVFGNNIAGTFNGGTRNQPISVLNRWKAPGDVALAQKYTTKTSLRQSLNNIYQSDAGWVDASYLRLKNVSLSMNLPDRLAKNVHLQNCSFFLQGQNLWTVTGYKGLDPETRNSSSLPPLRTIVLGIKVGL